MKGNYLPHTLFKKTQYTLRNAVDYVASRHHTHRSRCLIDRERTQYLGHFCTRAPLSLNLLCVIDEEGPSTCDTFSHRGNHIASRHGTY